MDLQFPIRSLALAAGLLFGEVNHVIRSITATSGAEKVEIEDQDGKAITLKHTRTVNGKPETTEYKAADIDALKLQSAEAATLYEKFTKNAATSLVKGGRPQVPLPANIRIPARAPRPFGDDPEPASVGPRRIRVDLDDRKLEIHDGPDSVIRMKVIKVIDGKEQIDEFITDNIRQLKTSRPDLCRLYEKYTGLKAE
jgi:hypothetical protein